MNQYIEPILYEFSYFELLGLTFIYFMLLYFGLAPLFQAACKFLHRKNVLQKIIEKEVPKTQIMFEIRNSLASIFVFGFSGIPVVYLIRNGFIALKPDTAFNVFAGVLILTLWNEVHFFIIHRIMHTKFFMRNVHAIHHRSNVPTVFSVYSFHWFEALLLSTVPVSILPFVSLSPTAVFLYPLASILLNYSGHCNYRFGKGIGSNWKIFATRHALHHLKNSKSFGFATFALDWLHSRCKQATGKVDL